MMKYSVRKSIEKVVVASFPVLAGTLTLRDAYLTASLCAAVFAGLAIFYKNMWSLFPKGMLGFTVVLTLACLGCWAWYFLDLGPLWIASVFLLGVFDFKVKRKRGQKNKEKNTPKIMSNSAAEILQRAAGFWLLILSLGLLYAVANGQRPLILPPHPGIAFLILAAVVGAAQYERQPFKKVKVPTENN